MKGGILVKSVDFFRKNNFPIPFDDTICVGYYLFFRLSLRSLMILNDEPDIPRLSLY